MQPARVCSYLAILAVAGCGGGDNASTGATPKPVPVTAPSAKPGTSAAGSKTDASLDTPPEPSSGGAGGSTDAAVVKPINRPGHGFYGRLKTPQGGSIAQTTVLGCTATTCFFGETDADGNFEFAIDPPRKVAFKTHEDLSTSPRRAAALCPVQVVDDVLVNLNDVFVPELPEGASIGPVADDPQTLSVGDGLSIAFSRRSLKPVLGESLVDAAARRIPNDQQPALPGLEAQNVVAIYALHPFGAHSTEPIAVRADSTLPAGTHVAFQTISELDGSLSAAVSGIADGTSVSTDAGTGIDELSWLVISRD